MAGKALNEEDLCGIALDVQIWLAEEGCMGPAWDRAARALDKMIQCYGASDRKLRAEAKKRRVTLSR